MRVTGKAPLFDVVVIGAGPAGLAATVAAAKGGARVALIDAGTQPGGQFWRHRSESAGLIDDGAYHHDWSSYLSLRADLDAAIAAGQVTYRPGTSVWMARRQEEGGFRLELAPSYGPGKAAVPSIAATRLVLATGGYDRQLPVPGWDLPGVMAAGGVQAHIKQNGSLPGSRFVIAGTGPFLLPVAANIAQAGGFVAAVLESANLRGWIPRAHRAVGVPAKAVEGAGYAWTFLRHRIPYRPRTVITQVLGSDRVTGVLTARLRPGGDLIAGSEREITGIDAVGLGWGFTPQLELPLQLGVDPRVDIDGSLIAPVDDGQRSSVAGLLLAGELTGVGGAALAVLEGTIAGRVAAAESTGRVGSLPHDSAASRVGSVSATTAELRFIRRQRGFARAMHLAHPVPALWQDRVPDECIVCRCEEVTAGSIRAARDELSSNDHRAQKGVTRAGMGWCQGRVCGYAASVIAEGGSPGKASLASAAKRPVAQPVLLSSLTDLAP